MNKVTTPSKARWIHGLDMKNPLMLYNTGQIHWLLLLNHSQLPLN